MRKTFFFFFIVIAAICSCIPPALSDAAPTQIPHSTNTAAPTWTVLPTQTAPPATPTPIRQSNICSPLESETLQSIQEIITQEFKQPRAGQDDGHHGVDFAHYRRNNLNSLEGVAIQSVLDGEVVTVINNRYPYGYSLIIETPLDNIAPELLTQFNIPKTTPTVVPDPKFNWAPMELPFSLSPDSRSLYVYYAHLLALPEVQVGQKVVCGQRIGLVGNSGDSSNPHLHFETRIGPSGARFESMAYYILQSTPSERYNYIVWRISNLFQLFDPMILLNVDG